MKYAHGALQWLSSLIAGDTSLVVSGLSFQPKAIRFYWLGLGSAVDAASETVDSRRGIGFATSTSSRRCVCTFDDDAAGTMLCGSGWRNDAIAATTTGSTTFDGLLDITAFNADGFGLTVDAAAPVNITVFWEAWGGDDITVAALVDIAEPAATGVQDYTVTGFTSDGVGQVVMFAGVQHVGLVNTAAGVDAGLCAGFASGTAAAENVTIAGNQDDGSTTADTDHYVQSGECLSMIALAGGNPNARAQLTLWNTNGFRLNWIARGTTDRRYIALAIKGGQWRAGELTIDLPTLNATATVSGLPFAPIGLSVCSCLDTEPTAGTSQVNDKICFGSGSSPSSRRAMGQFDENATASSACEVNLAIEYDQILVLPDGAGAVSVALDLSQMNNDGFQLIVDDAGGFSSTWVGYLTFGSAALSANVSDSTPATEAIDVQLQAIPLSLSVADAPAPSESAPVQIPMQVGPDQNLVNDSLMVDEAVTVAIPMAVVVSDADAPTEALEVYLNPLLAAVSDAEAVTEAIEIAQNPLTCDVADSAAATEAVTVAIPMQVTAFDAAPATEAVTILRNPLLAAVADDDVPVDAINAQISVNVLVTEVVGETEAVAVTVNPLVPVVADTLAPAETVAVTVAPLTVAVSDDDVAADVAVAALPMQVAVSDDAPATEVVGVQKNPLLVAVSDADAPGESVLVISGAAIPISVAEVVGETEAVAVTVNPLVPMVLDTDVVAEVVAVTVSPLTLSVSDDAPVAEVVTAAIPMAIVVSEDDPAAEFVSLAENPLLLVVFDADTVGENVQVYSGGSVLIAVADVDPPGELAVAAIPMAISVSDAMVTAEAVVAAINPLLVGVTDTVVPTDGVVLALPLPVLASDDVPVSELVAVLTNPILITVADSEAVAEAVALLMTSIAPLTVAAVDSIAIGERRSLLSVGLEFASFQNAAIRMTTVTEESVE